MANEEGAGIEEKAQGGLRRIRLLGGGALLLEVDGFRLIEPRGLHRSPLHDYEEICHVYRANRGLLIGIPDEVLWIRESDFVVPDEGPDAARQALLQRIEVRPGGERQLERMARVDALGAREGPPWIIWLIALLCLVATVLQLLEPMIEQVGAFLPELFSRGEYWRAITAHFLHDLSPTPFWLQPILPAFPVLPLHLAINVGGLLVLGPMVERPLGSWRTAIVVAMSALGMVLGIFAYGHLNVVGASGIVAGLAGAMLAMEIHYSPSLPTFWRLPRRVFVSALILQFFVIDQVFSSSLAGGAHVGGFAGGYFAAWSLGRPSPASLVPTPSLRFAGLCTLALFAISLFGAMPLARHDLGALERHAFRLYDTRDAVYLFEYDNAAAWLIATDRGASGEGLNLAVALADRAVSNTDRQIPNLLDTLAEALFQRGDRLGALFAIEEAIQLAPFESYFFEQRRRFLGQRDPDDRPPPPGVRPRDPVRPETLNSDPVVPRLTI